MRCDFRLDLGFEIGFFFGDLDCRQRVFVLILKIKECRRTSQGKKIRTETPEGQKTTMLLDMNVHSGELLLDNRGRLTTTCAFADPSHLASIKPLLTDIVCFLGVARYICISPCCLGMC